MQKKTLVPSGLNVLIKKNCIQKHFKLEKYNVTDYIITSSYTSNDLTRVPNYEISAF